MASRNVSRKTYFFWTLLFYSLCLCGLIWQAWQISENFFKFEVVKDINVFNPEESLNEDKVVYVCFSDDDIGNKTAEALLRQRYGRIVYVPLKERFEIHYNSKEIFSNTYGYEIIDELMIHSGYCYQFTLSDLYLNRKRLKKKLRYFKIAIGRKGSSFNRKRLVNVKTKWKNDTQQFFVRSHSFNITKLKSPYTDHCYDYTSNGFMDRNDAIADCNSDNIHFSDEKTIWKSKYNSSNATLWDKRFDKCDTSKFEVDCNVKLYLTKASIIKNYYIDDPCINFPPDTDASFSVISKAKIDDIDFFTYILGALGTWLGFSFIGINPVTYFIRKEDNCTADINQQTNQSNFKRELTRMNKKFTLFGQKLDKCNQTIKELEQSIIELKYNMRR